MVLDCEEDGKFEIEGACDGCARYSDDWTLSSCGDMMGKTGSRMGSLKTYGSCWRPEGVALIWNEKEEQR
jgi:hypothetical protein